MCACKSSSPSEVNNMSQEQPRRIADPGAGKDVHAPEHVAMWTDKITVGEVLETVGRTAGDKPVDRTDAAAIAAAEATASGLKVTLPGGVAAAAHLAADSNIWATQDEYKTKLADVLGGALERLPADKEVTREDAVRVAAAEIRATPELETRPGGVAATFRTAARLNEGV